MLVVGDVLVDVGSGADALVDVEGSVVAGAVTAGVEVSGGARGTLSGVASG